MRQAGTTKNESSNLDFDLEPDLDLDRDLDLDPDLDLFCSSSPWVSWMPSSTSSSSSLSSSSSAEEKKQNDSDEATQQLTFNVKLVFILEICHFSHI